MADKQQSEMINGVIGEVDKIKDAVNEVKTKYEPKSYDYSSIASTMKIVAVDGGQQASITPPAGVDAVPIGAYTKIIITPPGTPQETPGDDDQVTLNGSFLWINKVNTDIMQWKEIKDNVANGDIMIIERIADSGGFKNYQLVKWEIKPSAGGPTGHWEAIDQSTHHFTEPVKVRIGSVAGTTIIGYMQKIHSHYRVTVSGGYEVNKEYLYKWESNKADKANLDEIVKDYGVTPSTTTIIENKWAIRHFEIWKDA